MRVLATTTTTTTRRTTDDDDGRDARGGFDSPDSRLGIRRMPGTTDDGRDDDDGRRTTRILNQRTDDGSVSRRARRTDGRTDDGCARRTDGRARGRTRGRTRGRRGRRACPVRAVVRVRPNGRDASVQSDWVNGRKNAPVVSVGARRDGRRDGRRRRRARAGGFVVGVDAVVRFGSFGRGRFDSIPRARGWLFFFFEKNLNARARARIIRIINRSSYNLR